jgi:hypothetical protein
MALRVAYLTNSTATLLRLSSPLIETPERSTCPSRTRARNEWSKRAIKSEEQAPARLLLSLLNVEVFGGGITLSTFQ